MAERFTPSHTAAYQRPTLPFRCGRSGTWERPCWQGPDVGGRCGGTHECAPVRRGDRWECRRPAAAGGSCAQGPLPDGTCPHLRPACVPLPSLRKLRGRLTLLVCTLLIALLGAFVNFGGSSGGALAIDPGPLSNVHASFTSSAGCTSCHIEHDLDGLAWVASAFTSHDQPGQCLECHAFEGEDRAPHNTHYAGRQDLPDVGCAACHTEHKGNDFDTARVAQAACTNCHRADVRSFNESHPPFPKHFPHQKPGRINFDHAKHFGTYFDPNSKYAKQESRDAEFAGRARAACTACHAIDEAQREIAPRSFEETCAKCHAHQVRQRPLIVFVPEEASPVTAFMLALDEDIDDDELEEKLAQFLRTVEENGVDGLAAGVRKTHGNARPATLLEGLSASLIKAAAAAWQTEDAEFESPETNETDPGGWHAGEDDEGNQSLRYIARRHNDPVLRGWIAFLRKAYSDGDDAARERAQATLEFLLSDDEGAGACGKCHRAGLMQSRERLASVRDWRSGGDPIRPLTRFVHAPHISLLGPDASCRACHQIDPSADYAAYFEDPTDVEQYQSNFRAIDKGACERCHAPGQVSMACQLCHQYHRKPQFNPKFRALRQAGTPSGDEGLARHSGKT